MYPSEILLLELISESKHGNGLLSEMVPEKLQTNGIDI